ncbi:MAG: hypothetical protein R3Y09_13410 [Clostridia bacterium]
MEKKKRTAIWLYPQTFDKIDEVIDVDNFKNRSEFIEKAVDFYIGYINSKDSTSYLAENLQTVLKGTMQTTENRMSNTLFRLTVEMSMMMYILAQGLEITEESLQILRARCIKEIKSTKGKIRFENVIESEK